MFEHSVKVPRQYKIAANIFKKVSTEGGSVKTLLYDNKLRHFRTNVLFALLNETIKHAAEIDKLFEDTEILSKEARLDPWLAKVLTTELLYGKQSLPGRSKPELTILNYKDQFEKYVAAHQDVTKIEAVPKPRYVRINTNLLTTSDAIRAFQDESYRFVRCTSGAYDDYLKQIQGLAEDEFTQDYHVKTVFVFPSGTRMHDHPLYLENQIILQDKATAMAVHLLAPPPGSVVLDMCAAPGMKTTQMAAYMRNEGTIYAVERNEARYNTLCDFVEKTGSKCVKTLHRDAFDVKGEEFENVEYVLLDPSCSGSGMELSVHSYIDPTRLAKLTSLQEKFLKHAMNAFPKAKRIVYSTCSIHPEENERVVTNVVKMSRAKWWVKDVKELLKGQWNNFGSHVYGTLGAKCMYAKPDLDLTRGFFLAVLERDLEKEDVRKRRVKNNDGNDEVLSNSGKGKRNKKTKETELVEEDDSQEHATKKKKKNKHSVKEEVETGVNLENITEDIETEINAEHSKEECTRKKKRNKRKEGNLVIEAGQDDIENNDNDSEKKESAKKKKRKHKDNEDNAEVENTFEAENGIEEESGSVEVPKKKKRKKEEVLDNPIANEQIECENVDVSVKKKKGNKNKEVSD